MLKLFQLKIKKSNIIKILNRVMKTETQNHKLQTILPQISLYKQNIFSETETSIKTLITLFTFPSALLRIRLSQLKHIYHS